MSLPLLATKISIPPLRETRVSRSRLLNRLEGSLSRKLTLISSPAGFGKTTLLSEFASVSDRQTVSLWDVKPGQALVVLEDPYVTSVAFSPDGTLIATSGKYVHLWGVPED